MNTPMLNKTKLQYISIPNKAMPTKSIDILSNSIVGIRILL